jgi:hypothetical protein
VEYQSIAPDGECISLWYRPSWLRRMLRHVGVSSPLGGASYDSTGRLARTQEGKWHHYVKDEDEK